jgi:hypothetical protein
MNTRFLAATILALAVLLSQGGGLVLAAICPHLRAQHAASCHENTHENSAHHQHMGHEMAPAGDAEVFESEETAVSCNHCAIHSRTKRDDSALQSSNTLQRESDPPVLISFRSVEPESLLNAPAWSPQAHGPPVDTGPLHLLHNVFRI